MHQRGKNSSFGLFIWIIAFIIISPQYLYVIGGVNIVNALAVFAIIFYLIAFQKIYKARIGTAILFAWLFYLIFDIQCLLTVGVFKYITYLLLFILIPYLAYSLINTEERLLGAIDIIIKAGVVLGIYGIIEQILKVNVLQQFVPDGQFVFHEIRYGLLRIMGTFGQPIGYGLFNVFIVSLIIYRMNNRYVKNGKFLKIAYVIAVLNVIFSVSRIPIMALILLHMLLITKISKRKAVNYTVFGIIGVFLGTLVLSAFNIKIPLIDDLVQTLMLVMDGGIGTNTSTTVGVGSRFDLWFWVTASMGNKWIAGHGVAAQFSYKVYEWATKTSIENQYLNILYYNGLIGLISMLISFFTVLFVTRKSDKKLSFENDISFNAISFLLMIIYYFCQFGTQESDMTRLYVFYLVLIFAYNRLLRTSKGDVL